MNQSTLPGASTTLTMGILSVVGALMCCGPFAAIFSVIGLIQAKKAKKLYESQPSLYTGYENVKTGKVLSYVGLGLSIFMLLLLILYFGVIIALVTTGNIDDF
ncbi:CCC motif membrane protein [Zeaxanthinibacter enoshimensis]|uniref:DUF4190 domain-containing protein n=1 Tax=Zeaxanthinibacter enoshimensis TaxID=392009 RepID=A0A4R6TMG7_9FLAO|nr:CCC motif membrane protein [Zeaxanthinibacter enoshimensis]TDQ29291.1 hypothetical protein CLV82_2746 [Zeaxanthinibacter enoshimensis]